MVLYTHYISVYYNFKYCIFNDGGMLDGIARNHKKCTQYVNLHVTTELPIYIVYSQEACPRLRRHAGKPETPAVEIIAGDEMTIADDQSAKVAGAGGTSRKYYL